MVEDRKVLENKRRRRHKQARAAALPVYYATLLLHGIDVDEAGWPRSLAAAQAVKNAQTAYDAAYRDELLRLKGVSPVDRETIYDDDQT